MKQRTRQKSPPAISPRRKRIFSIIVLSVPILFFALIEISLRVFDYGPDLSLFTTATVAGKSYYQMNPSVRDRYFSRFDFAPTTSLEYFHVSKPPGTFRIFCLGGSTTVGYPYWYNAAFSSFLRDRLKAVFPDRPIEIINVGMTATNSYTVLDFSNDLIKYEPDLFIVYDGHNEFYGALGSASNERVASARWLTLLYLRAIHLRTFQLAKNGISALLSMFAETPIDYSNRATMMEQVARGKNFSYQSEKYFQCLSIFQQNLESLIERCRAYGIPIMLGTQVSNLRDQAPFISNHSPGISQPQQSRFQKLYTSGLELRSKGLLDSAIVIFRSAIAYDSLFADAHYQLAQCLDGQGRRGEAYVEYIRARDYDELRFRTDSKFNNLIRSMEDREQCFVADIETVFKSLSQDSLVGHNLILEHLHPNPRGHFFIAREYARLMREHNLLASHEEWARRDTVSDDFLWSRRPLTEVDELIAARRTEALVSGWPFKNEPPSSVDAIAQTDTLRFIAEQASRNQIGWRAAHRRAAEYYMERGDYPNAEKEYKTLINQLPFDVASYLRLAQIYFNQKAFADAESVLLTSLQVYQTPIAYRVLGDIYMKQGKLDQAVRFYEELARFPDDPAAPENACVLALAYLSSGKPEPAIRHLELAVNRYPAYQPAKELLAKVKLMVMKSSPH